MRVPGPCHQGRGPLMRIGCSAECCERRPCGSIGLPAAITTSRFPARPMAPRPSSSPVPLRTRVHPLVSFGLLSRVRTASNLPSARMRRTPSLGFSSPSRCQPWRSTWRPGIPRPTYVPPSTFRTSSTACSLHDLVGLFHPTTTSGIRLSGVSSRRPAGTTSSVARALLSLIRLACRLVAEPAPAPRTSPPGP
jgi:hypothetical protein